MRKGLLPRGKGWPDRIVRSLNYVLCAIGKGLIKDANDLRARVRFFLFVCLFVRFFVLHALISRAAQQHVLALARHVR
jgi:hypothetical protein